MKIVWVATKSPWPPSEGGRLVMKLTVEAMASRGHEITVAFPGDPPPPGEAPAGVRVARVEAKRRSWAAAAAEGLVRGLPAAAVRHASPALAAVVEKLLKEGGDVVFAEQLQALPACESAFARRIPVLLRAQNVESDLWAARAASGGRGRVLLRLEARRMAAWEARAIRRCAGVMALTAADAARLGGLVGAEPPIVAIPAPFPAELPPAEASLSGSPSVVVFGSSGWWANAESAEWFAGRIWPALFRKFPAARLHLFGRSAEGVVPEGAILHPAPRESRPVFDRASIFVVPLRSGSGVRMKILEAWARGVPVVATSAAAAGLEDRSGLLVADDADGFEHALRRIAEETGLRARLAAAGRDCLRRFHDPAEVARSTESFAREAIARNQVAERGGGVIGTDRPPFA